MVLRAYRRCVLGQGKLSISLLYFFRPLLNYLPNLQRRKLGEIWLTANTLETYSHWPENIDRARCSCRHSSVGFFQRKDLVLLLAKSQFKNIFAHLDEHSANAAIDRVKQQFISDVRVALILTTMRIHDTYPVVHARSSLFYSPDSFCFLLPQRSRP